MKHEARFFKSLADETRLQILWLLMVKEELCVCDIMGVIGITQSKASRHLRYLYNLGLVTDRREGLWMYYRIAVPPGSWQEKQLKLLAEMVQDQPAPRFCGSGWNSGSNQVQTMPSCKVTISSERSRRYKL